MTTQWSTQWFNADTLQCLAEDDDGDWLVGEAFFNGGEWIFFCYTRDGAVDNAAGQMYIEIDPTLEVEMREQQQEIAAEEDPTKRAVLQAELKGRRLMFRDDDENRDLVRIRAMGLARRYLRDGTLKKEA
jgi:hypothetical protein